MGLNQLFSKKDVIAKSETTKQSQKIMRLPRPAFGGTRNDELYNLLNKFLLFLFVLLLPTQLGKHFFFDFSYLSGVRVDYLAPTIYLTDVLAVSLFIFNLKFIIKSFSNKKILLLLFIFLINILFSQNKYLAIYRYIKIVELLGVFFIFQKKQISSRLLLWGLFIGASLELGLSISQFISRHSLQGVFYFLGERLLSLSLPGIAKASLNGIQILRPYGTFSHPNSLAGFYLLLYFFILTKFDLVLSNKKYASFSLTRNIFLFFSTLLIFFSFSKIAIALFLVLNFIYFWQSPLRKKCKICLFSRIFIILILSLVFVQAKADPLSLEKRLALISNSARLIRQHPIIGVGIGNYLIAQNQFSAKYADFLNQPVHNIFLLVLSEMGVIITLILSLTFRKESTRIFKKFPYVFAVILLTGMFDHYWLTLQQNFLLIGVVLGAL